MGLVPAKPYRLALLPSGSFFRNSFLDPCKRTLLHTRSPGDKPVSRLDHADRPVGGQEGGSRKAHRPGQERILPVRELDSRNPRLVVSNERLNFHAAPPSRNHCPSSSAPPLRDTF